MKKLFLTSVLGLFVAGQISWARPAGWDMVHDDKDPSPIDSLIQGPGDDPVPWPWGSEMPFPWPFVQGFWMAEKGGYRSYFSFRIVKDKNSLRQLEVEQIDPSTCESVARGVGVESNNIVRAQMTAVNGQIYRLSVRSFSEKSVPSTMVSHRPIYGQYVVLSLFPFDSVGGVHLPIQLISSQLSFKCLAEK